MDNQDVSDLFDLWVESRHTDVFAAGILGPLVGYDVMKKYAQVSDPWEQDLVMGRELDAYFADPYRNPELTNPAGGRFDEAAEALRHAIATRETDQYEANYERAARLLHEAQVEREHHPDFLAPRGSYTPPVVSMPQWHGSPWWAPPRTLARRNGGDALGVPELAATVAADDSESFYAIVVTPVLSFRSHPSQDKTGWTWDVAKALKDTPEVGFFEQAATTISETDNEPLPTRSDAVRQALDFIEHLPSLTPGAHPKIAALKRQLDFDDHLARLVGTSLLAHITADDQPTYAHLLDQVVAGLGGDSSGVQTTQVKRVIAGMIRNREAIHLALRNALPPKSHATPVGETLRKGWIMGYKGPYQLFQPHIAADNIDPMWDEVRATFVLPDQGNTEWRPNIVLVPASEWAETIHSATEGTLLFVYNKTREIMPAELVRLKFGWHLVDGRTGDIEGVDSESTYDPHKASNVRSDREVLSVLSPTHTVFMVDGRKLRIPQLGIGSKPRETEWDSIVSKAQNPERFYAVLGALAPFLPQYPVWGALSVATRAIEYEAQQRAVKGEFGFRHIPTPNALQRAKKKVLYEQRQELLYRAQRRFVAGRLGLGVNLPVRRNFIPLLIEAVVLVLPFIVEKLGTTVEAFNALPRIERQRKLIAILSSKLWWLSLNPVTVVAARQVAASAKMQNLVLDLLERHGAGAVEAAGDAARAFAAKK